MLWHRLGTVIGSQLTIQSKQKTPEIIPNDISTIKWTNCKLIHRRRIKKNWDLWIWNSPITFQFPEHWKISTLWLVHILQCYFSYENYSEKINRAKKVLWNRSIHKLSIPYLKVSLIVLIWLVCLFVCDLGLVSVQCKTLMLQGFSIFVFLQSIFSFQK